ncbi:hypothetical protein EDD16DRAFT_1524837 [Pisolithus croceorrhizus]|nr:hypothetical protein EV401DRAFT_1894411 [Pisolithus croceorrhizus]KAI6104039.1 hypothetical protein EDD16DRAFT_1524837 [Pisolithus croceorrhizus]KAI6166158.1 hypothetical protein EDD17DRAFT_1505583 [Pisolithus thermaeus]
MHVCLRQNWDTSGLAPSIQVPKSDTTDPIQVITSAPPVNTQDMTSEAELKSPNSPVTPAAAAAGSMHTEMDQMSPDLKLGTRNVEEGHRNVQDDPNEPLINFNWPLMPSNKPEKCSVHFEALTSKFKETMVANPPASPSECSHTHSEAREWLHRLQQLSSHLKLPNQSKPAPQQLKPLYLTQNGSILESNSVRVTLWTHSHGTRDDTSGGSVVTGVEGKQAHCEAVEPCHNNQQQVAYKSRMHSNNLEIPDKGNQHLNGTPQGHCHRKYISTL